MIQIYNISASPMGQVVLPYASKRIAESVERKRIRQRLLAEERAKLPSAPPAYWYEERKRAIEQARQRERQVVAQRMSRMKTAAQKAEEQMRWARTYAIRDREAAEKLRKDLELARDRAEYEVDRQRIAQLTAQRMVLAARDRALQAEESERQARQDAAGAEAVKRQRQAIQLERARSLQEQREVVRQRTEQQRDEVALRSAQARAVAENMRSQVAQAHQQTRRMPAEPAEARPYIVLPAVSKRRGARIVATAQRAAPPVNAVIPRSPTGVRNSAVQAYQAQLSSRYPGLTGRQIAQAQLTAFRQRAAG